MASRVLAGTNLEVPRAALLLAHWHHAPNLRIQLGGYMANLLDAPQVRRAFPRVPISIAMACLALNRTSPSISRICGAWT